MNPLVPSTEAATRAAAGSAAAARRPRPKSKVNASADFQDRVLAARQAEAGPLVSVIVPTYNEAGNITVLLERLASTLDEHRYEIIIVDDDSSDGTWQAAEQLAVTDDRISVIRRTEERGLSSAVLAGMHAASGDTLIVIDADLQHDERKIPDLVAAIVDRRVDICLGSREADGGSYGSFKRRRRLVSWAGAALARQLLGVPVSDPMSGFFAVSRERFEAVHDQVNPRGFKIMLEFLARGTRPEVAEVGYRFGERVNGATKLTGSVGMDYLRALAGLMAHRIARRARKQTLGQVSKAGTSAGDR